MFGARKKHLNSHPICAPFSGRVVNLESVPDETFSRKLLGDGFAIEPSSEKIVSPVTGVVTVQQNHAIGILADNGLEILIHIGIDTVKLQGHPFTISVKEGEKIKVGQILGTVDWEQIESANVPKTTMVLITNTSEKLEKIALTKGQAEAGKPVAQVEIKEEEIKNQKESPVKGYLQKLGKSLMMPISIIAAAGIFLGLASVLQNPAIVGENFVNLLAVQNSIGFIKAIVAALFGNLPILFAISVTIGLAKTEKANAAFSAVIGFLLMHVTISYFLNLRGINVTTASIEALQEAGKSVVQATKQASLYESVLGIFTYRMNVFGGVVSGILTAWVHNRFYKTELPVFISFFGGKRLVPIMTTIFSPILGAFLFFIWPFLGAGIENIGNVIANAGLLGTFLFGSLERLLVPTGLHHILNQLVRFTPIGGVATIDGEQFVGALNIFNEQLALATPDMDIMRSATKLLSQGKIPFMVFGLPAAALAMYHTAAPENKTKVKGFLFAAALATFMTGITEPLEFSFIFLSPILFVFHALMAGFSFMFTNLLGVSIGNVQGGFIDLGVFGILRGVETRWFFEVLLGAIYAPAYYFVFKKVILWKNLKTPGRELELDARDVSEVKVSQSNNLGQAIVAALGGGGNIEAIDNCFTRLRMVLKDSEKIDEAALKTTGAAGVIKLDKSNVQVVYGPQVEGIALKVKEASGKAEE
ncbi:MULTISPECIES: glucose PTS transporter subunit IIA [Lactococcus]|uniref:Glucose PTS transporter subunit IIA n=1 Tax=Lactococcus petauri TaxID=1940789 RepID=A0AAJ2ML45_9LACT|nr:MULTISPECIES: glucose PTS transporter subunit IIA [Lactococcus]MCH1713920.1 glucose PTS transporter subunit IIA [Lactococcus petauri]MDT2526096.1 glucose PTS transporter subunit IIA [Lactococcus petauri]MDT2540641.1 glucose PTS transporter subunit IIA [Lactococcus petauri]MDT2557216.1 glucose PTS transporter subunit IIA [Lactococcus petauri]MDT2559710.1 glucose PTS transporter subunit IIA [Lactococcus petauri]